MKHTILFSFLLLIFSVVSFGQKKIFDAVEKGDIEALKSYISKGGNLNIEMEKDYTLGNGTGTTGQVSLLQWAVLRNKTEIVDLFLENTSRINNSKKYLSEAFPVAAATGNETIIMKLLENETNLNQGCKLFNGKTALFLAVEKANLSLFYFLTELGAKLDVSDNDGNNLIQASVVSGNRQMTGILLKNGAQIDHKNKFGVTPIMYAAAKGNFEMFSLLAENKADLNILDKEGLSLLSYAAFGGNPEIIRFLVGQDLDVNHKDKKRTTPLAIAVFENKTDAVRVLGENKANVNYQLDGSPLLALAMQNGNLDIAWILLSNNEIDLTNFDYLQHAKKCKIKDREFLEQLEKKIKNI